MKKQNKSKKFKPPNVSHTRSLGEENKSEFVADINFFLTQIFSLWRF